MKLAVLPLYCLFAVSACNATTLLFDFNGAKLSGDEETATGSGMITFADGLVQAGLSDVTNFAFDMTSCICKPQFGYPNPPYYFPKSWSGLSDLSLTLGANGLPTEVGLMTTEISAMDGSTWSINTFSGLFFGNTDFALFGPVTFTATPEPGAVGLMMLGLMALTASQQACVPGIRTRLQRQRRETQ